MIDPKSINEVMQKIIEGMPKGLKNLPSEMQHNLKSAIHRAFETLDLVTHEEFDTQRKVLLRTREKLEQLEKKIAALEAKKK